MTLQFSLDVHNARLAKLAEIAGANPVLRIRTGAAPATCAAADSGTVLMAATLPATIMETPAGGSVVKAGTWEDSAANASGLAEHFRLYTDVGNVCKVQGTVSGPGGGGDLILDNATITVNQPITIIGFTLLDGDTALTGLVPVVSDGFTFRFGVSDGRGHANGQASYLTTVPGAGGSGFVWSKSGTSVWTTTNGRAICTSLGVDTTARAWIEAGISNVRVAANVTRASGAIGVLVRYVDQNNYAYASITNTNLRVHQVIGGATTTLYDSAATIVTNGEIAVEVNGLAWTLHYNGASITSGTFNASLSGATKCGLWTNNTSNSAGNLLVYDLSDYPGGETVETGLAFVSVANSSDVTSQLVPGGTVTQHSWVNATATDASRTSSDPLWGTLGPIAIHLRHFGFTNNMSGQAAGSDEATRVTNTINGANIDFTLHDTVITRLKNNGVTQLVLKIWGFPDWMLDAATGPDAINRTFQTTYRAEAAAYVRAFIKRYNTDNTVPGIRFTHADWGHEWKGGYSSDVARFEADYNAIYAAIKAQDNTVLVGGPYRVLRGNGSVNFGQADAPETREPIISDDRDKIASFLANATDFNFLSFDAKTWVDSAPTLTYDQSVQLFPYWTRYIEELKLIAGYAGEPLMLSEGYGFNINDYATFTEAQQGALHSAMLYYCARHGVGHFLHWIVEKPAGQARYGYWNSTNDNPASPVVTTPAYDVHLLYKDNFGVGTALYPVTTTGDSGGLLVLASLSKVLLINLRGSARNVLYGNTGYYLAAYQTRLINR